MSLGLHWADYLVFSLFLLASLAIGVYHALTGGRQRTTSEFLLGDRRLRVLPTMLSLLVSFQSAIMILGHTAEMYTRGVQVWPMVIIGFSLAIVIAERILCPWMYPLKLTSVFQYLELRFASRTVRILGAVLGTISGVLYMGVAMFAPSIALQAATGFPVTASIPIMAAVTTAYTTVGGMKAVIWTDVFQFVIMMSGMVAVLIKGNLVIGGFGTAMQLSGMNGRLIWADFSFDPRVRHTVWGLTLAWAITWSFTYGLSQPSIQRYSATRTEREARLILLTNIPPLILMTCVACMIGLTVLGYYSMIQCDPLASGQIQNPNQLLAIFVITIFSDLKGFAGLFLATLYSGALSSVSSALTASAAVMWEDVFKWKLESRLSEYGATVFNKITVVVFGCLATAVAFMAVKVPGPITQIAITMLGAVGGPTFGLFLLGGIFRKAEWKGATAGCLLAFAFIVWMSIGHQNLKGLQPPLPPVSIENCTETPHRGMNLTTLSLDQFVDGSTTPPTLIQNTSTPLIYSLSGVENLYAVSYLWYSTIGTSVTVIIGMAISLICNCLSKTPPPDIPTEYFIPFGKAFSLNCGSETDSTHCSKTVESKSNPEEMDAIQADPLLNKEGIKTCQRRLNP